MTTFQEILKEEFERAMSNKGLKVVRVSDDYEEEASTLCPDCILTALNDLRTAIIEQNSILEYLLVATAKKHAARDTTRHLNSIDLVKDLLMGGDDSDLCGDSPEVD